MGNSTSNDPLVWLGRHVRPGNCATLYYVSSLLPISDGINVRGTFGPFEIIGQIGAGGMGEVYRVRDTRLGRDVAVKVLPANLTDDDDRHVAEMGQDLLRIEHVR